jgi:hypothetical protein
MEMTKANVLNFKNDFEKAMKELEEKYGVAVTMKSANIGEYYFTTKIEVVNETAENDAEKVKFEEDVALFKEYGLTKDDYQKKFKIDGEVYSLIGFKTNARKNKFILCNNKGTKYVFSTFDLNLKYNPKDIGHWTIKVTNGNGEESTVNI